MKYLILTILFSSTSFALSPDLISIPGSKDCEVHIHSKVMDKVYKFRMKNCNADSPEVDKFIEEVYKAENEKIKYVREQLRKHLSMFGEKCNTKDKPKEVLLIHSS